MANLLVIIGSTRPGRVGWPVAQWFIKTAQQHPAFSVQVADLKEINLPFLDESKHPRLGEYAHEHTRRWSRIVDSADAISLVLPEYNFAMTAPVKNAFDYLSREWQYKPLGLVSYGGISGGLRAAQMVKQVATTLKMMPIPEAVAVPNVAQYIQHETFHPSSVISDSAYTMLDELARWEEALRPLRMSQSASANR